MYLWIIRYEGPSSLNELFSFGDGHAFFSKPNCTRSISSPWVTGIFSILGLFIV